MKKLILILLISIVTFVTLTSNSSSAFFKRIETAKTDNYTRVIVIDAGHGGKDTGAVGPDGIKEKDVTLSIALELKRVLTKKNAFKVVLTREDDREIDLDKRAQAATAAKADLFISIHANSSEYRAVKGVETFFLSFEASDNEARLVAARENNVPAIEAGPDRGKDFLKDEDPFNNEAINNILTDMVQTESHHESSRLAELIHKSLIKATGARNRGVRQAPFRVLAGTAVPAVLLELGFLSNKSEAQKLVRPKTQQAIARAITSAVVQFDNNRATVAQRDRIAESSERPKRLELSAEEKTENRKSGKHL
ncbi:N-acetylmuramoyl-L-alanine amidase [hydrothermal vent metagenome]|uniref:N-acetylmuramoyl-L-alanine amidase n=1 Tax=hydrothermal vent metagenome TaxID=652676 RepID=A0A3B0QSU3_9ZZZZ